MAGKINVGSAVDTEEKEQCREERAEERTQKCRLNRLGQKYNEYMPKMQFSWYERKLVK